MSILGSAWDNLTGGLGYTWSLATGKDQARLWARQATYNQWMLTTLKMWQAAPGELLDVLEDQLASGIITIGQFNNVINRRNTLYRNAGLTPPGGSTKTITAPPIKDQLPGIGKNIADATKDVIDSIGKTGADGAMGVANGVVGTVMGIPTSAVALFIGVLVIMKIMK